MNNKCKKFVLLLWNISNISITSKFYYNMIKDDFRVGVSQILGWLFSSSNRSFEVYILRGNYLLITLKPSTPFTDYIVFNFEYFKGRSILSGDFLHEMLLHCLNCRLWRNFWMKDLVLTLKYYLLIRWYCSLLKNYLQCCFYLNMIIACLIIS